jgi:hypothetical protein
MTEMKTPGVCIVEMTAFPNSVVEVATAVPVFIGYTQKAVNGGKGLKCLPWRITSMDEYIQYFGGPPQPAFSVAEVSDPPVPTVGEKPKATDARGQLSHFMWNAKRYSLTRAPKRAGGRFLMHLAMRHFFQNGGAACYIVSVGDYEQDDIEAAGLIAGLEPLLREQEPTMVLTPDAVLLDESSCILVQQQVLAHCGGKMKNRVAILDIWGGDRDRKDPEFNWSCIDNFRSDLGSNYLDFAAAYYPWLHTTLVQPGELDYSAFGDATDLTALGALLKAELGITDASLAAEAHLQQRSDVIDDMSKTDGAWLAKLQAEIQASKTKTDAEKLTAQEEIDAVFQGGQMAEPDPDKLKAFLVPHKALLQRRLVALSPLYAKLVEEACTQMNLLPPAAAMAGIYTMVDNTRGVWKSPANVSLASVIKPAVEISSGDQEDLNVSVDGKSINAIRSFIGEGTLVWGARTLDGNSLDWRYINVRRTMIMLEESCRLAAQAMAFEPNVATTWVTVKAMVANFLTGVWQRGGLAGAVADDAFSVHVGLGETMTPEDILEGILRVTVLVAVSHPAEFIEITFQQQMQKP